MLQTGRIEFTVLDFLTLNSFWPRFVLICGAACDIHFRTWDFDGCYDAITMVKVS
jgi:hypothetical protein